MVVLYQKLQLSMEITTTASAADLCDPLLDTLELGTSSNYMATCGGSKSGNTFTFDIKYPLNHNSSIYTTDQINTKTEEVKTNVTSADFPTDFQTTAAASGRRLLVDMTGRRRLGSTLLGWFMRIPGIQTASDLYNWFTRDPTTELQQGIDKVNRRRLVAITVDPASVAAPVGALDAEVIITVEVLAADTSSFDVLETAASSVSSTAAAVNATTIA